MPNQLIALEPETYGILRELITQYRSGRGLPVPPVGERRTGGEWALVKRLERVSAEEPVEGDRTDGRLVYRGVIQRWTANAVQADDVGADVYLLDANGGSLEDGTVYIAQASGVWDNPQTVLGEPTLDPRPLYVTSRGVGSPVVTDVACVEGNIVVTKSGD
jgi:hypothetical protein